MMFDYIAMGIGSAPVDPQVLAGDSAALAAFPEVPRAPPQPTSRVRSNGIRFRRRSTRSSTSSSKSSASAFRT